MMNEGNILNNKGRERDREIGKQSNKCGSVSGGEEKTERKKDRWRKEEFKKKKGIRRE